MPRKVTLVAVVVAICLCTSTRARAKDDSEGSGGTTVTTVASVSNNGEILSVGVGAGAHEPGSTGAADPGTAAGGPPPVVCVWMNYDLKDPRIIASTAVKVIDHITSILQESVCNGLPTGTLRWFEIVTDESVIWATYAKAKTHIDKQMPLLGPVGVQYRSWPTNIYFKPEQLAAPPATATLPSGFAITVQPVAKVVTFHSGTSGGEAFVCPTLPVAVEQCQYTYRETSKDADDLKFFASVSIEWAFLFNSTGPGKITFPSETLNQPLRIPVAKIQTVGA